MIAFVLFDRTSQSLFQSKIDVNPTNRILMFFHALCIYCAWRGSFKSNESRSLWFLSMGSKQKKYCRSVAQIFNLQNNYPELMMECEFIAHPTWWMYSKNCAEWTHCLVRKSIILRPEWTWSPRKYRIVPDESIQYWFMFLFPPPAILFFHLSSDQWWPCKNVSKNRLRFSRIE